MNFPRTLSPSNALVLPPADNDDDDDDDDDENDDDDDDASPSLVSQDLLFDLPRPNHLHRIRCITHISVGVIVIASVIIKNTKLTGRRGRSRWMPGRMQMQARHWSHHQTFEIKNNMFLPRCYV